MALSVHLNNYTNTIKSKEQIVILEYTDVSLVIPKILVVNAAEDGLEQRGRTQQHAKIDKAGPAGWHDLREPCHEDHRAYHIKY